MYYLSLNTDEVVSTSFLYGQEVVFNMSSQILTSEEFIHITGMSYFKPNKGLNSIVLIFKTNYVILLI